MLKTIKMSISFYKETKYIPMTIIKSNDWKKVIFFLLILILLLKLKNMIYPSLAR